MPPSRIKQMIKIGIENLLAFMNKNTFDVKGVWMDDFDIVEGILEELNG